MFPDLQLWPQNSPVAISIILILCALFLFWFAWWMRVSGRIARARTELGRSADAVDVILAEMARSNDANFSPDAACSTALSSADIRSDGEIGAHIRTVFVGGLRDAAPDLAEVNHRTIEAVCGRESALRAFLGTFVIVGLLGTLMGIAYAVGVFGANENLDKRASPAADDSAKELLGRLPGAFTPSIFGVFFSIVGSLLLVRTRAQAAAFSVALRSQTIEVLVTRLVPSHSEKIDRAATRAVAAAQRVVKFAENIEERSRDIHDSLDDASSCSRVMSEGMREMSRGVTAAGGVVDRTLLDLSGKVAEFSGTLDRFAALREVMEHHEQRVVEVLKQIAASAAENSDAAGEIAGLTRNLRVEVLNATREIYKPVKESADEIKRTSIHFEEVCRTLMGEVAETAKAQTGVLQEQFTKWRSELNEGADRAKRSLDNLKAPFEESALKLSQQAAYSIQQMSTLLEELNRRGDGLMNALNGLVAPLRELAVKGVAANGAAYASETPQIRLADAEWHRIREMVEGVRIPIASGAGVATAEQVLVLRSLGGLDGRLARLDATLQQLADAMRPKTSKRWLPGFLRRTPRARAASTERDVA